MLLILHAIIQHLITLNTENLLLQFLNQQHNAHNSKYVYTDIQGLNKALPDCQYNGHIINEMKTEDWN
jgi:hypothetical protein